MAQLTDKSERRLLPIWKSFNSSAQELQPISSSPIRGGDISSFLYDWKTCENMANAGDVISAAIINSCTDMEEVREVADYVIDFRNEATSALYKNACSILGVYDDGEERYEIWPQIALQKNLLGKYPSDAILHIEVARNYLLLGQIKHAQKHIEQALYFDHNNRYIVRCAVRFYIHIKDPERALYVVRKSSLTRKDPWLMASEIGVSQVLNKTSANLKRGMNIIASNNYNMFDITELSSAIGTQELINGAYSKSRKLFNISLKKPNSNSLAQAKWVCNVANLELDFEKVVFNPEIFLEAGCYNEFRAKEYSKSLEFAERWIEQEPYSTRAIFYAYGLAVNYLEDLGRGEKILEEALKTHYKNSALINNYAYTLVLEGKVARAEEWLAKVKKIDVGSTDISDICLTATSGMIAFRKGEKSKGESLYNSAIERAKNRRDYPDMYFSALLNLCRELLLDDNSGENKNRVRNIMEEIPQNIGGQELINLRKQVNLMLNDILCGD